MAEKKEKKSAGGHNKKELNIDLIFSLAKIHCTKEEIASIVGCHRDTLYARCSDILRKGYDEGKSSLKRLQWQSAEKGSVPMQIWLGKQWLGQKDRQPDEVENTITYNVIVNEVP